MAAYFRVNKNAVLAAVRDGLKKERKELTEIAASLAENIYTRKKASFFDEFDGHPVTKEIAAGPNAATGVLEVGNLFSFIGFQKGVRPIDKLRKYLNEAIFFRRQGAIYRGRDLNYLFKVELPTRGGVKAATKEDMEEDAPFDSWVYAVEEGISNLAFYKYVAGASLSKSKSGPALQKDTKPGAKEVNPGADFKGTEYLTDMVDRLKSLIEE